MRRVAWPAFVLLAGLAAMPSRAETIYKCRSDSGAISYGASPCRPGSRLEDQRDYADPAVPVAPRQAPAETGRDAVREPVDQWPRRPDMDEARRQAAAAEERARLEAERDKQAEKDPKGSLKCIELRRRIGLGGITAGHAMAEGCL